MKKRKEEKYQSFGMKTRVNDSIHVKIEIVELHTVRVRAGGVDRDRNAADIKRRFFHDVGDCKRILLR